MRHRGRANKRDTNEPEIIQALEAIGCSVCQIDAPADLLVGYKVRNFILEIKSKDGKQTKEQVDFALTWRGQYRIVKTPEEAIDLVTKAYGRKD